MAITEPTEKGIAPPNGLGLDESGAFLKWLRILQLSYPKTRTAKQTLDPSSVAANSESTQTFTVEGLTTMDIVTVNKPSDTAGLSISQAWVSAADTLSIKFRNHTGSPIDPASEDYLIAAIRR